MLRNNKKVVQITANVKLYRYLKISIPGKVLVNQILIFQVVLILLKNYPTQQTTQSFATHDVKKSKGTHPYPTCHEKQFNVNKKCFLFNLKSSFHSWDIQVFVILSFPFQTFQIQKGKRKWNNLWCHELACINLQM